MARDEFAGEAIILYENLVKEMEKKEAPEEGSLFASEDPKSKPTTRPNPMLHPMTNADDYKRKRDEDAELFRKKHREQIFKSKRMYEEEQPSLEIPDVGPKAPEHHVQPMVEPGKVPTTEAPVSLADLPAIIQEFYSPAPETCLVGLKKLRRLLSTQGQTPVQEVLDLGVLPRLLELLKCTDKQQIQVRSLLRINLWDSSRLPGASPTSPPATRPTSWQ